TLPLPPCATLLPTRRSSDLQGKIPQESWFTLGRLLTQSNSGPILLSWSGSMFEYLMPQLVMPSYEHTLLYQTNIATVKRQIEYGDRKSTRLNSSHVSISYAV